MNNNFKVRYNNNMNIRRYTKYLGIGLSVMLLIFIFIFFLLLYPLKHTALIDKYAKEYDVDSYIIASIINAESSFNKKAVSKAGAVGLMQVLPQTAKWICKQNGEEYSLEKLKDANFNIRVGTYYLKYLITKFKNLDVAICAYNAGEGVVGEWLKNEDYSDDNKTLKTIPYLETRNYLKAVKSGLLVYKFRLTI